MTTVTVDFFKESGKWNRTESFTTDTHPAESDLIIEQIKDRYRIDCGVAYVFKAERDGMINYRLVQ